MDGKCKLGHVYKNDFEKRQERLNDTRKEILAVEIDFGGVKDAARKSQLTKILVDEYQDQDDRDILPHFDEY